METIKEVIEPIETEKKTEDYDIQYAFNNMQLLFDPAETQSREDLCKLIDSDLQPKAIMFFFITNTCNIVEGLTAGHLSVVIAKIQTFTDEEVIRWAKFIFECFSTPIDIFKSGQIYAIWGMLFVISGIEAHRTDILEVADVQSINQTINTEVITEQLSLEPEITE